MPRSSRYSPEVQERAVRLVQEHRAEHPSQWAAISSIAGKLGCTAHHSSAGPARPWPWRSALGPTLSGIGNFDCRRSLVA